MPEPSHLIAAPPVSDIRGVRARAATMPDVARLEVGEPQSHKPGHIVEAAFASACGGLMKYTSSAGLPSTREAVIAYVERRARPNHEVIGGGA